MWENSHTTVMQKRQILLLVISGASGADAAFLRRQFYRSNVRIAVTKYFKVQALLYGERHLGHF